MSGKFPIRNPQSAIRNPIRILQAVGAMNRAGVETWLMHVLRNVDRDRVSIDFLVHTEEAGAYEDEILSLGSKVIRCRGAANPLAFRRNFDRAIREHGPYDIIHSHVHHFSGLLLRLAEGAGIPARIVQSHCDTTFRQSDAGLLRRAYLGASRRWINRYATLGLAVSRDSARDLFGPEWESDPRWRIFRLGFDFSPFRADVNREAVRAELGIPPNAFVVGHIGRFEEQKNHGFLMQVANELIRLEPRAYVLLVGDGRLRPMVERSLLEMGIADRVLLLGSRPDVPRLMLGAMDVLTLPSLFEGLPVVLIEAQAAGLPCVISDVIPDEGDVVGSLIQRLPLSRVASDWTQALLSAGRSAKPVKQPEALRLMEKSPFDIKASLAELEGIYEGVMHG